MIDYQKVIDYYYPEETMPELREILVKHSRYVAELAAKVCEAHPELKADKDFVYAAAMLHDIGIVRCDATGIHCYGAEPYLCHGVIGAQMIQETGMLDADDACAVARVCARHTGTGLTAENIRERKLPLPEEDLVPETVEEQIICYADKFFSKTHLDYHKSYEQALHSLEKFGEHGVKVFSEWHKRFHVE